MAIKIDFDINHIPQQSTLIIAYRNGDKIGKLSNVYSVEVVDNMKSYSEISFNIDKYVDGKENNYWNEIKDFRLVWCKEWDTWFEATVSLTEKNQNSTKNVNLIRLGEAELSQIRLYNIEINTEKDIKRDDYKPTILYNTSDKNASLLDRLLEKAPHYSIAHVDNSIRTLQRAFTFNNQSITDAIDNICEEFNCICLYKSNSNSDGSINRSLYFYDLESYCIDCQTRGAFVDKCPKCNSTNILQGYGEDTTIYVDSENIADELTSEVDSKSVKNYFKLIAGDNLMTATVKNCIPNGSGYIWNITDDIKNDMSLDLRSKLNEYDILYNSYKTKSFSFTSEFILNYNSIVNKYKPYGLKIGNMINPIVGYDKLSNLYYDILDLSMFLKSAMLPIVAIANTTALKQVAMLNGGAIGSVSVNNLSSLSTQTANLTVVDYAKLIIDSRYQVKVNSGSITKSSNTVTWTGDLIITNYSDETDKATTNILTITINDNYKNFVKQKIDKVINSNTAFNKRKDNYTGDITGLFAMSQDAFDMEIKKYCLDTLKAFYDISNACLNVMIEQGLADKKTWASKNPDLYTELYSPFYNKLKSISAAIKSISDDLFLLNSSIVSVNGITKNKNDIITTVSDMLLKTQSNLNFKNYLGDILWTELYSYCREDTYENKNFISKGLDNTQLFNRAKEFIELANNEIFKSANLQHSITAKLKNILVMKEFEPLVNKFSCGNWIRLRVGDKLYKLRILNYKIPFDNIDNLTVSFSDVKVTSTGLNDIQNILDSSKKISSSYDYVKYQAEQGSKSNDKLSNWVDNGLSLTNMNIVGNAENQDIIWDKNGMIFREYDPILGRYDDKQLKIINRGLYVTDDGWETAKAGIGNFNYYDVKDNVIKDSYGVIADTIVGNIMLSKEVGIYNPNNSMSLDENGFCLTTRSEYNNDNIFTIQKETTNDAGEKELTKQFYIDNDGNIVMNINKLMIQGEDKFKNLESFKQKYDDENLNEKVNILNEQLEGYKQNFTFSDKGLMISSDSNSKSRATFTNNGISIQNGNMKLVIKDNKLSFMNGNTEVAWIRDKDLHITSGVFVENMIVGNHKFEKYNDGSDFTIVSHI